MALLSSGSHAPIGRARQNIIHEHTDLEGHREGVSRQTTSIRRMYGALIRREGELTRDDLEDYYQPHHTHNVTSGYYGEANYAEFYENVVREQLPNLPGVTRSGDSYEFAGIDPDADTVDEEHVRPLSELREDPRTGARNAIEDAHGPDTDASEDLLDLWDHVADAGETATEDMASARRLPDLEEYADELADLPHIERERIGPPVPEEIEIETYADVLEAEERVGAGSVTEWRYTA